MRLIDRYREWKKPKPHPLTGDMLLPGERITWRVMSIYRRWSVFCALQVLTLVWWTFPSVFPGGLPAWNYVWSDLAIVVEMMVGIAFLNQSMRDARVIRSELTEVGEILRDVREDARLIREIHVVTCGRSNSGGAT
jgi:hypothetical protein